LPSRGLIIGAIGWGEIEFVIGGEKAGIGQTEEKENGKEKGGNGM
jgi:hypothetical protein